MSIFDSQRNRGRFLVVVFVLLFIGARIVTGWGAKEADRESARRASEIRTALEGRTADALRPAFLPGRSGAAVPGGPYDTVISDQDGGSGRASRSAGASSPAASGWT